ncbi:hypothetical protein E2C01_090376 [Portunus trituberculatus]|uniref:Uncharacterized protein n=1 Tax=Portunus trituberculatus TaxID=210409 RepID=A0A5B7JPX8_PORTR|nr:hypothetical protein [Portunus trituberculatus]
MGLQLGLVGRWARFTLYMDNGSDGSLVVEVCSDRGEYGCCHVTAFPETTTTKVKSQAHQQIPLEYDVQGCKVRVAWLPMQQTRYTLVLSSYGQHILGSPYTINVDESQAPSNQYEEATDWFVACPVIHRGFDRVSSCMLCCRFLSILRRRVVRRVLHIGDRHVVLRGSECIDRSSRTREVSCSLNPTIHSLLSLLHLAT